MEKFFKKTSVLFDFFGTITTSCLLCDILNKFIARPGKHPPKDSSMKGQFLLQNEIFSLNLLSKILDPFTH